MLNKFVELWTGWMGHGDPRTANFPLIADPTIPLYLCIVYVLFSSKIGPYLMKDVPAFECKIPMIIYNVFQIIGNAYVFTQACKFLADVKIFGCIDLDYNSTDFETIEMLHVAWYFFILKLMDLIDTVFMVLRKKNHQISFLHVYHHTIMVFAMWMCIKYMCGGPVVFFGMLNSFVHTVMYSYYLLTALKPEYKKSIWWKKHITEMQMVQFVLTAIHMSYHLFISKCLIPLFWGVMFVFQNFYMLYMFWNFYKKAYLRSANNKEKE